MSYIKLKDSIKEKRNVINSWESNNMSVSPFVDKVRIRSVESVNV